MRAFYLASASALDAYDAAVHCTLMDAASVGHSALTINGKTMRDTSDRQKSCDATRDLFVANRA